jgi:predicted Zn-dependent protease with MMP-like domain
MSTAFEHHYIVLYGRGQVYGSGKAGKGILCRMPSSGMLRRAALLRTAASEESIASIIRVTRIGEIGTMLALTSNLSTLRRNTKLLVNG